MSVYSSCEKNIVGGRNGGRRRGGGGGGGVDYNDCCIRRHDDNDHDNDNDEASAEEQMETIESDNNNNINENINENENENWIYKNEYLNKLDFPLGGFGCGNILLEGDGTIQGWDIQNQFSSKEYIPNHKLPSNYWCISAIYDDDNDNDNDNEEVGGEDNQDDDEEEEDKPIRPRPRPSYLLRSSLPRSDSGEEHRGQQQQQRRRPPEIPSLQIEAKYPIATITYNVPQQSTLQSKSLQSLQSSPSPSPSPYPSSPAELFPNISIQMEALSPLIPTSTKVSSLPLAVFTFTITNNHPIKSISFDLMQSTINFIGWDGYTDCESKSSSSSSSSSSDDNAENQNQNQSSSSSSSFWNENINKPFVYYDNDSTSSNSNSNSNSTTTTRRTTKGRENNNNDNYNTAYSSDKDKIVNRRTCTGIFMYTQRDLKEQITSKGSIALSAITNTNTNTNTNTKTTTDDDDDDDDDDEKSTKTTTTKMKVQLITGVTSDNELFDKFALRDFDNEPDDPTSSSKEEATKPTEPSKEGQTYIGGVIQSISKLQPLQQIECTFVLSWHFPYRPSTSPRDNLPSTSIWGNQYNKWFTDAKDVACQFCDDKWFDDAPATSSSSVSTTVSNTSIKSISVVDNNESTTATNDDSPKMKEATTLDGISLLELTRLYVKTLYGSTIPYEILESAASKLATMRSPTMFWIEPPPSTADDPNATGIVLGNEGNECCPLNCTHVYGYTTLLERFYPDLAKNMRRSDFILNFDLSSSGEGDGNAGEGCTMRFGRQNGVGFGFALDGSLACVIKTYLVVLQSDPTLHFLKSVWPNVKKQMELLWTKPYLDPKDGVIYISQQNTYDTAMDGANTYIGSYLIVALKATSIMASLMGDINFAKKCSKQVEISTTKYEELCWNSTFKYYIADVNETNCQNSYSIGCFIDQLCAIGLSTACGFGAIFDPTHEAQARQSILRNNKITESSSATGTGSYLHHHHTDHFYPGDTGIRVCTYPNGKLGKGMPYQNLVSSGFEYPLAAGMILDDNIEDAIAVCKMVRKRQSGIHRSPFNEPECGLNYARSMAGWNLFDQACGFTYDSTKSSIGFNPNKKMIEMMMLKKNANNSSSNNSNINNKREDIIIAGATATAEEPSSSSSSYTFTCFCTFHCGFGEFQQKVKSIYDDEDRGFSAGTIQFQVLFGTTKLQSIHLKTSSHVVVAALFDNDHHTKLNASVDPNGVITFDSEITMNAGSILKLTLSSPCACYCEKSPLNDDHYAGTMKTILVSALPASSSSSSSFTTTTTTTTDIVTWIYSSSINSILFFSGILMITFILRNVGQFIVWKV